MIKLKFPLFLLLCFVAATTCAQNHLAATLNIDDPAPPLRVRDWIKGPPVHAIEKGKVYVIDFWATWCAPCIASMPHLSALAHEYKDKVTFLGIDIDEDKVIRNRSIARIKAFVDSMGHRMDFPVALDDSDFMAHHWYEASDPNGIPCDFVVNSQGRVAWIGNPATLDEVLPKILNKSWDVEEARSKRIFNKQLNELDFKTASSLYYKWKKLDQRKRADSMLSAINRIVKKKPNLKYAPDIATSTFWALLSTNNLQKAYEFGKMVIVTSTYLNPAYSGIIYSIENPPFEIEITPKIYRLDAEAYQAEINYTYPIYRKLLDTPEIYHKMAAWYRLANNKLKANEARQKSFNTVIVQRFKTKKDAISSTLVFNNPYLLGSSTSLHPVITDGKDGLTRIYKLYLQDRTTFMVDGVYHFWLIKRGDSLVFEESNYYHNPSDWGINFKTSNNTGLILPDIYTDKTLREHFSNILYNYYFTHHSQNISAFNSWMEKAYNIENIKTKAQAATTEYLERDPNTSDSKYNRAYLKSWYEQMILRYNENILESKYSKIFDKDSALIEKIDSHILQLAAGLDQQNKIKTMNYWMAIRNIYDDILSKMAKKHHYNIGFIDRKLNPFSDTTRQFIFLCMIGDHNSAIFHKNLSWTTIAGRIKLKAFQPFSKRVFKRRIDHGKWISEC